MRRLRGRLPPEAMFPADRRDIRVRYATLAGGVRVRLAESGAEGAPPIVLLHGWGASIYMWRDWFAPLAAAGFRAVALDLPGHGLSDKPDESRHYRLEGLVGALRELLTGERLESAPLVAQSMGGTIALEHALAQLDASAPSPPALVLVNPAAFGRVLMQPLARLASPPLVERVLHWFVPRWIVARAHRNAYGDPRRVTVRDQEEYWAPSQFPEYTRAMRRLLHEFTWRRAPADAMAARLRRLARPPLVILGGRDRLVLDASAYVRELRAGGAPLAVEEIAEGGHAVNEELPERVIALAIAYLAAGGPSAHVDDESRPM